MFREYLYYQLASVYYIKTGLFPDSVCLGGGKFRVENYGVGPEVLGVKYYLPEFSSADQVTGINVLSYLDHLVEHYFFRGESQGIKLLQRFFSKVAKLGAKPH